MARPHDDYQRTYCDTGLVVSILFWGFFLVAQVRSFMLAVRGKDRQLRAGAWLLVVALTCSR